MINFEKKQGHRLLNLAVSLYIPIFVHNSEAEAAVQYKLYFVGKQVHLVEHSLLGETRNSHLLRSFPCGNR